MRILDGRLVFSPSDLSGFLSSPFATWMDRFAREYPDEAPAADAEDALLTVLAKRGLGHEASFEQRFRDAGLEVVNVDDKASVDSEALSMSSDDDVARRRSLTIEALKAGVDVVAQATLVGDRFAGVADFLVRVPGRSELGDYHYEVWDTKLARCIRPGFVIQLCCYVEMLELVQGCRAEHLVVALGNGREERVRLVEWLRERQQENDIPTLVETDVRQEEIPDEVISARLAMRDQLLSDAESLHLNENHTAATVSENLAGLLEFHRREAKPVWWRYFDRHSSTPAQLFHDPACLAQCWRTERIAFKPTDRARNLAYEYRFRLGQDFKGLPTQIELLGERTDNDKPVLASVVHALSDFEAGLVMLQSASEPPAHVTLILNEFVNPAPIPDAIDAVVEQWLHDPRGASGIDDFLFRRAPRFKSPRQGAIVQGDTSDARLAATIEAVSDLDDSYLTIQGPPGCGKSYTGARIIAALCAKGCKVGISSNSHAAIQNLMKGAALYCLKQGITARFICTRQPDDELLELGVDVTTKARLAAALEPATVVGTTAWGFARKDLADEFDYLLIDEAGQVSVANLLAMSRAARNLVLLGDQMQLGQPCQGSHSADSGLPGLATTRVSSVEQLKKVNLVAGLSSQSLEYE